jgi:hypothetical protein
MYLCSPGQPRMGHSTPCPGGWGQGLLDGQERVGCSLCPVPVLHWAVWAQSWQAPGTIHREICNSLHGGAGSPSPATQSKRVVATWVVSAFWIQLSLKLLHSGESFPWIWAALEKGTPQLHISVVNKRCIPPTPAGVPRPAYHPSSVSV